MKRKYLIGVAISVLVLTCNQIFIQYWLQKKKEDAEVINIAGRQRMLSQRINLEFYKIHDGHTTSENLNSFLNQWMRAHNALLNGDDQWDLHPVDDSEAQILLKQLTPIISAVSKKAHYNSTMNEAELIEVSTELNDFLQVMDAAVKKLEQSANNKLVFIIITEIILALISILIIVSEVFLIYRPISKRLESHILALEDSEKSLRDKNEKLKRIAHIQSHELRRPLSNILGLVHLIKFDDRDEYNPLYLEKLKTSAEDLEKSISNIVENTKTFKGDTIDDISQIGDS
ncbi:His Kinase A (phospho-acceptor) domain-containing protein [Pustulibacterium marinum]|uniref:histidine kinase n=1 Tax=Pustulibacterium marinum TaxID=1224947 RepID=A0A1I7HZX3_9FLAO|nr:type IV pili methyl-accepting chemotaxis transducer N-terminal domain-containing protein [Pustulibacterium marinum]SFU66230.1 His Kinase A (phospho-acceptor) domain-containing protein [Pustulibacterium marinum]